MVSINLIIKSKYVTILNFLTMIILSWLAYYGFLIFVHFSILFNSVASMGVTFLSALLHLDWVIVIGITNLLDFFIYSWNINSRNSVANILLIERKEKGSLETTHDLPSELEKYIKVYNRMNE